MYLAGRFIFHSNSQPLAPGRAWSTWLSLPGHPKLGWNAPSKAGRCGWFLIPSGGATGSLVCHCTPPCWLLHEIQGPFPPPPPKGRAFLVTPWNADSLPWQKFRHVAGQLVCQEFFLYQRKAVIRLRATLRPRLPLVCLQQCQLKVSGIRWGLVNLHEVIG